MSSECNESAQNTRDRDIQHSTRQRESTPQSAAVPLNRDDTRLNGKKRMLITFTFFSMFFGAGNLIFPPFLGAQAGRQSLGATLGFIVSAVGLPIFGVLAVANAGGFEHLASRVSKRFALVLGLAIILSIGPCFAIPRTATTSYEMAIVPFTSNIPSWLTQLVYSLVFFLLAFVLSQHPERLSRTVGRFMVPLLLIFIAALFIACLVNGQQAFKPAMGNYAHGQLTRGFIDGYQTMDLLAGLYFGMVVSANITNMGISDEHNNRNETSIAGIGAGILLACIYAILSYIGAVSGALAPINPDSDTGATVLTNLSSALFGPLGTAFIGLVFVIACFNVCTGLIATCSTYFHNQFPTLAGHRVNYRTWTAIFAVFSFIVSNAGLNVIIKVSLPVLGALYPIAIVLVILSLLHTVFSKYFPRVYQWSVLLVGVFTIFECIVSLIELCGIRLYAIDAMLASLPLSQADMTWLIPAVIGLMFGIVDSQIRKRHANRNS